MAYGGGELQSQCFTLNIYLISNLTNATLVNSFTVAGQLLAEGDWMQWSGLGVPLAAGTNYAWTFGIARNAPSDNWEALATATGWPYTGGQACDILDAGGAGSVIYPSDGKQYDAVFNIGLATNAPQTNAPGLSTYYVDPVNGSDGNAGTQAAPFQTIGRAQQAVRAINGSMTNDITVYLRGGTYWLTNALQFNQLDSGSGGHSVIYAGYPGETAILDGGQVIGNWTSTTGGIYQASATGLQFRQLYVNGVRAVRARTPNAGTMLRISSCNTSSEVFNVYSTNMPSFTADSTNNPAEIVLHSYWTALRARIASVSASGTNSAIALMDPDKTIMFNMITGWLPLDIDTPFFLENAYQFLDQPGEWYLKTSTGVVYYMRRAGENMATAQVIVPRATMTNLVMVAGTAVSTPVHDLQFSNLVFQDTTWLGPNSFGHVDDQANQIWYDSNIDAYHTPAAVMLSMAHRITVSGCVFRNLGGVGLDLGAGCQTNTINGNQFDGLSDNAINDAVPAASTTNRYDVIANNFITDICLDYESGVGILICFANHETVQNNEIFNVPYTGISVGWSWSYGLSGTSNNVVQNNHIMHSCSSLDDGGSVYANGYQPGLVIQSNYFQDNWYGPYAAEGHVIAPVYLDAGSSNALVQNNVWTNIELLNMPGMGTAGNIFTNNGSQSLSIITNAGILPQYQSIRPWPMPSQTPGNFQGVLNLGLSYAPGYTIYYTTNGNDPDMLVVGEVGWGPSLHATGLTPDEQYSHISMWCMLSAPLLIGCDLEHLDPFTLNLLSNDEVLALDQDALGKQAVRVATVGPVDVYLKELEDGSSALGFFNRDSAVQHINFNKLTFLGFKGRLHVRDLWRQQDLPDIGDAANEPLKMIEPLKMTIPAHGVQLYKISAAK